MRDFRVHHSERAGRIESSEFSSRIATESSEKSVGTTCQVSGSVTVSRYTLQEQTHGHREIARKRDATNPSDHTRTITLRQRFSVGFG